MEPYEELANAIILQAVEDYRTALRKLKKHPKNSEIMGDAMECERFFRSRWFHVLTTLDGELLIRRLQEEARGK